jgi:SAM-dependent methyltransferase
VLNHVTQSQHTPALEKKALGEIMHASTCPACGHHVAVGFLDGGKHPLSILAWPASREEAQGMKRLPLDFLRCVDCGHVYNQGFEYDEVPYSEKPNLMFNNGITWGDHLASIRDKILARVPENPVIVEIGCGDGQLIRALADACPSGRYIGFDPSGTLTADRPNIEAHACLFDPAVHLKEFKPDLIISRHVMEHLKNPLAFIQAIAFAATWEGLDTSLFIEVPCIDRVFHTGRTIDFFYEHNSHFTTTSLNRFLSRSSSRVDGIERGYGDEVVYGFARLGGRVDQLTFARDALAFSQRAEAGKTSVQAQLATWLERGKRIAIWGGTGKSSTFINRFELDAERFPCVVDSDPGKVGTFVPGTGQEIQLSDDLKHAPVDVILITTQWRAKDIYLEIQSKGIPFETILIEHKGEIIDFLSTPNPYYHGTAYASNPKKFKKLGGGQASSDRVSSKRIQAPQ